LYERLPTDCKTVFRAWKRRKWEWETKFVGYSNYAILDSLGKEFYMLNCQDYITWLSVKYSKTPLFTFIFVNMVYLRSRFLLLLVIVSLIIIPCNYSYIDVFMTSWYIIIVIDLIQLLFSKCTFRISIPDLIVKSLLVFLIPLFVSKVTPLFQIKK